MINALSPSNFIATNPELLRLTLEKNGENLIAGLEQLKEDVASSADILKIRMTNNNAFRLGEDVANTPGEVVFKNEVFELIQYKPLTEQVAVTPLLIVPPFINKYYILDLREKNSMVRWLVEQGHSVFMISWRNPGAAQAQLNFEDYVLEGVVKAVNAIESITGQEQINAAGYCIGGTVLATTIAYYAAKRMKNASKPRAFSPPCWISLNREKWEPTSTTPLFEPLSCKIMPKAIWMAAHSASRSVCCVKIACTGITTWTTT